jgi:hypothetical protein
MTAKAALSCGFMGGGPSRLCNEEQWNSESSLPARLLSRLMKLSQSKKSFVLILIDV